MPFKLKDESRDLLIALAVVVTLAVLMSQCQYAGFTPPVNDYRIDEIEIAEVDDE